MTPDRLEGAALDVRGLRKEFGGVVAVEDLHFSVEPGEILGLLGVNGAGKTTAMNMILGLVTPTAGEVSILGLPMPRKRIAALRQCNFCSAYAALPANLLVWQNLWIFGLIYGVRSPLTRGRALLESFEIGHLYHRVTGHLSSGEATRLALCKALLNAPQLLMLDEPTASLDPDIADKVRKALLRLREETGMAVLYTSHNMRDVEEVCDRIIFVHHGRVVAEGTPRDVLRTTSDASLEQLFIRLARGGALEDGPAGEGRRS
jgi:ABC-2 type transport system ATP-binding protein